MGLNEASVLKDILYGCGNKAQRSVHYNNEEGNGGAPFFLEVVKLFRPASTAGPTHQYTAEVSTRLLCHS